MLDGYEINGVAGVVHQLSDIEVKYDTDYVDHYAHLPTVQRINEIRWDVVNRVPFIRLLDFGCGTGSFVDHCRLRGKEAFGYDVAPYLRSREVKTPFDDYDVVCFFDSLEHLISPHLMMATIHCKYVVVSVPWYHDLGDDWFRDWKHRKPGEHLWHFDAVSLCRFMNWASFKPLYLSNPEDEIRPSSDRHPNILTGVFYK